MDKGDACKICTDTHGYDIVPGMRVIIEDENSESRYNSLMLFDAVTKKQVIHYQVPEDKIVATI